MAVGGRLAIGGDASVKGSARVGRNLRVDGWLDARNIKGSDKGLHASQQELEAAYPHPRRGWWAMVGECLPAELWVVREGCWAATGRKAGSTAANLEAVEKALAQLTSRVDALEQTVADMQQGAVASFDGIVNAFDTSLKAQTSHSASDAECEVIFVNTLQRFVLQVSTLSTQGGEDADYYGQWTGSEAYCGADDKPIAATIYVCRANGQAYRWTGAALVAV